MPIFIEFYKHSVFQCIRWWQHSTGGGRERDVVEWGEGDLHRSRMWGITNQVKNNPNTNVQSLGSGKVKIWKWKSDSLWSHGLYSPWNSPGEDTGVGSCSLLQGVFPTQGSNPGLLHCRRILYQLSHQGSPRILEWVACPFSSGSSWPKNWTGASCIVGGVDSLLTEPPGKPQALETMGQVRQTRHSLVVVLNCLAVTPLVFCIRGKANLL